MSVLGLNTEPNNTLYGSSVVNGQLVPTLTFRQVFPSQAAAPYFYGNGSKPATLAGFAPTGGIGGGPISTASGNGVGFADSAYDGNPWSPTASPLPWAIAFLLIGFIGLRHIHWRAE